MLEESGGAIYAEGPVNLQNATLQGNAAHEGGAIYATGTATVTASNSTFMQNSATTNGGAIAGQGHIQIGNSEFNTNIAAGGEGGAIYAVDGDLHIQAGRFINNVSDEAGGALSVLAMTRPVATTIQSSQIYSNSARWGGGGVAIQATEGYTSVASLAYSRVISNHVNLSIGAGGGILSYVHGAGENGNSTNGHINLTVVDSTVRTNRAATGGGIASGTGDGTGSGSLVLVVLRSLVAYNVAGLEAMTEPVPDQNDGLSIAGSTNNAVGQGGGIYSAGGTVTVANSTLSGNRAVTPDVGMGGALANFGLLGNAAVEIVNSTVVSNTASQSGGALANFRSVTYTAEIGIQNSLLAFNDAPAPNTRTCSRDVVLSIFSRGNNLESGNSCGFDQNTDILLTNPRIRELADNGGPTLTHALRSSSPAINRGNLSACLDGPIFQRDQRGVLRSNVVCDIGAYAFDPSTSMMPTIFNNFTQNNNADMPPPDNDNEENGDEQNGDEGNGDEGNGDEENGDEGNGDPDNGETEE